LVLGAQKILHHLHRRECRDGNVDEDRVPLRHRTVPESRKLLRTQIAAAGGFRRDESRRGIGVPAQIELSPLRIAHAADEVHRIEMGGVGENIPGPVIIHIDLHALENLEI